MRKIDLTPFSQLSRLRSLAGLKLVAINDLAFYVNEKAFNIDKDLRKSSEELTKEFKKISSGERVKRQKRFLASLS